MKWQASESLYTLVVVSHLRINLAKMLTVIDWLSIIQKSDQPDKIKLDFFQAVTVSVLLYWRTTWTLTKRIKKTRWQLHKNTTRCSEKIPEATPHKPAAILPFTSHLTNHPFLSWELRRTRHGRQWWKRKGEFISDVLLWIRKHGGSSWPTSKSLHQLCAETRCSLEDLPRTITHKDQ